ncbi:sensory transduction protein regX3 [Actinoplanes capillaceus]|uniref:Sensory transduction protein regX3 n=1 Tax=Actinoplanes campanulatus TaxID=113559 RepID=A0ABQ3WS81_9ACTN|nr:response regulator transcription factor [Actinoplanes capillaceus]GID49153.1 sensory transduction protein regX3 [Actinoplanes capillaceus]
MLDEPALPPVCQPMAPRTARTRFLLIIADPEEEVARPLADALRQSQIDVVVVTDPAEALLEVGALAPDAVLTAAHVPPMTGSVIARALYSKACIPTLVGIGPHDGDEAGPALAAGARACVPRPYRLADILPQLRVIAPHTVSDFQTVVEVGALRLDPAAFEVHLRGERIALPLREFQLLHLLMQNAGRVLTRHQIHQLIWSQEEDTSNTLNVHVRRIRARLGDDLRHPRILISVRGLGYRLDPP